MKIILKDIYKSFSKEELLSNVNLVFEGGKVYGIVGTNGCGKTVLLKIITGLLKPSSGEVFYNEQRIGKDIKILPNCGVIIDRPYFFEELNGFDNLKLLSKIKNTINNDRILDVMKMVGLKNDKKPVSKFSLGMKQRLGIAQAIMENPDILILDELTNGLDEDIIPYIYQIIRDFAKDNKVIILTSHNKHDIEELCDVVFKIKSGEILYDE